MTVSLGQSEAYEIAPRLLAEALADEYSDDPADYEHAEAREWDDTAPAHCNFIVTPDTTKDIISGLREPGMLWSEWELTDGYSCLQRERTQTVAGATRCGITVIDTGEHRIVYFGGF